MGIRPLSKRWMGMDRTLLTSILASAFILSLACSFSLAEKGSTHGVFSEIIVPDQYPTIQEAVNNAANGDTIFVRAGTYYEHVVVSKAVSLVGEDRSTTIIDGSGTGTVVLVQSNNVSVTGFTTQRGHYGIYVQNSKYESIFNNIVTHNYGGEWDAGIHLESASDNKIFSNIITDNAYGISFSSSSSNAVCGNSITVNNLDGVWLSSESNSNTVSGNDVASNSGIGINLDYSSTTTVCENNIANNSYGMYLCSSSTNTIYHNNYVNNLDQVFPSSSGGNVWDDGYPSGGNYWSDYTGIDANSDGIGDTPYEVDDYNVDRYPLVNPWSSGGLRGDINDDGTVDIYDAILLSNAFNSEPGDPKWNPNADINGDNAVDIYDAIILANNFGKH